MLSVGSKECTKELKLECAKFLGHLGLISDPLTDSNFHNETHDPEGHDKRNLHYREGQGVVLQHK